jgi:hypothetical protein
MVPQQCKKARKLACNACVAKRVRLRDNDKVRIVTKKKGVFFVAKFKKSSADQIR